MDGTSVSLAWAAAFDDDKTLTTKTTKDTKERTRLRPCLCALRELCGSRSLGVLCGSRSLGVLCGSRSLGVLCGSRSIWRSRATRMMTSVRPARGQRLDEGAVDFDRYARLEQIDRHDETPLIRFIAQKDAFDAGERAFDHADAIALVEMHVWKHRH